MDTSANECKNRLAKKKNRDRIEKNGIRFHSDVYKRYVKLLKKEKNVLWFKGESDELSLSCEIVEKTIGLLSNKSPMIL